MEFTNFNEELATILEISANDLCDDIEFDSENWNSLSIVATTVVIDEQFGFQIEGDKLASCLKVSDLWQLIEQSSQNC